MDSSATGTVAAAAALNRNILPSIHDKRPSAAASPTHHRRMLQHRRTTNTNTNPVFAVNEECTSLKFAPSGRWIAAGFADGTLRLFDLTGTYNINNHDRKDGRNARVEEANERAESGSDSENEAFTSDDNNNNPDPVTVLALLHRRHKTGKMVLSKEHQQYGAVACQIHAKGVHTSLRMDVDIADDGQWCFAGVLRGSMELVAVHLGALEASFDRDNHDNNNSDNTTNNDERNLLDLVTVYRHGDAKLRGFGACTRLRSCEKYLLLTGKAIKNIHIWSFTPPRQAGELPVWECLYDTATNGNTIKLLAFRHNNLSLQALSKSDNQKLRVWDLQYEQEEPASRNDAPTKQRPSRPPFHDVANTESLLGIAGEFGICGGDEFFNQMSIVRLDTPAAAAFNHTEIALPGATSTSALALSRGGISSSSRRPQRGDLKCVVSVATSRAAGRHALLELSDGSVAHYHSGSTTTAAVLRSVVWPPPEQGPWGRQFAVGRQGRHVVAVAATYHPATGQGNIRLRVLDEDNEKEEVTVSVPETGNAAAVAKSSASVVVKAKAPSTASLGNRKVPTEEPNKSKVSNGFRTEKDLSTFVTAETSKCVSKKKTQAPSKSIAPTTAVLVKAASVKRKSEKKNVACLAEDPAVRSNQSSTIKPTAVTTTEPADGHLAKIVTTTKKYRKIGVENSVHKTARRGDQSLVTPGTAPSRTVSSSIPSSHSRAPSNASLFARRLATPFTAVKEKQNTPRVSFGSTDEPHSSQEKEAAGATMTVTENNADNLQDSRKRKNEPNSLSSIEEQQQQSKKRHATKSVKTVGSVRATENVEANQSLSLEPRVQDVSTLKAFSKTNLAALRESTRSPVPTAHDGSSIISRGVTSPSCVRSPTPYSSRRDPGATRELILEVCHQKLAEVATLLHEHNHVPNVWERRAILGKLQQENDHAAFAQYKLQTEHREAHRRMSQNILIMVQKTIQSIQEAPSQLTLDQARGFFQTALDVYQQQADTMIERQWLELVSLEAIRRDPNNKNCQGPHQPSGFPTMFALARKCFPEIVQSL